MLGHCVLGLNLQMPPSLPLHPREEGAAEGHAWLAEAFCQRLCPARGTPGSGRTIPKNRPRLAFSFRAPALAPCPALPFLRAAPRPPHWGAGAGQGGPPGAATDSRAGGGARRSPAAAGSSRHCLPLYGRPAATAAGGLPCRSGWRGRCESEPLQRRCSRRQQSHGEGGWLYVRPGRLPSSLLLRPPAWRVGGRGITTTRDASCLRRGGRAGPGLLTPAPGCPAGQGGASEPICERGSAPACQPSASGWAGDAAGC